MQVYPIHLRGTFECFLFSFLFYQIYDGKQLCDFLDCLSGWNCPFKIGSFLNENNWLLDERCFPLRLNPR